MDPLNVCCSHNCGALTQAFFKVYAKSNTACLTKIISAAYRFVGALSVALGVAHSGCQIVSAPPVRWLAFRDKPLFRFNIRGCCDAFNALFFV